MKARLMLVWDSFRESFWFLPILMSLLAVMLAAGTEWLDRAVELRLEQVAPWATTSASTARSALAAVASAMITLTGVIFSITVVTVSMASSQYGSRLLRSFMTNSIADFVMGAFVGTGLFCLVILRTVRDIADTPDPFTPHISTGIAMLMGLFSAGLLIYFIHDIAISIQAPNIVESLAKDLHSAIERLYPEELKELPQDADDLGRADDQRAKERQDLPPAPVEHRQFASHKATIASKKEGYLEGIDYDTLADAAAQVEGTLEITCSTGHFVAEHDVVARIETPRPLKADELDAVADRIRSAFVVGGRRTPRQDVSCPVYELVDVALRALSPGINDPFTAANCVDRLGAAMAKLVQRAVPNRDVQDDSGRWLVHSAAKSSASVIHDAFRQIRQYGASSASVAIRLIEALSKISAVATRHADFVAVMQEADAVRATLYRQDPLPIDQNDFDQRYAMLLEIVAQRSSLKPSRAELGEDVARSESAPVA